MSERFAQLESPARAPAIGEPHNWLKIIETGAKILEAAQLPGLTAAEKKELVELNARQGLSERA